MHVHVDVAVLTCMDSPLLYLEAAEAKRQHRNSSEQLLTEVRSGEDGYRGLWEGSDLRAAELGNIFVMR